MGLADLSRRTGRILVVVTFLAATAVGGLAPISAHAVSPNSILGPLDPASPSANPYAGCIAATLVGNGFTFGSLQVIGTQLDALWPNIPNGVAQACKTAVDTHQPQVCMVPTAPTLCSGIGSAYNAAWVAQAAALDTWDVTPDSGYFGGSAINHYPADVSVANGPQARLTFNVGQLSLQNCGRGCPGQPITNLPFTI